MFRLSIINGEQFQSSLMATVNTMQGLDEASRKVALLEIFKNLILMQNHFYQHCIQ